MTLAVRWIDAHRGAALILVGHAVLFWGVVGLGSPWATMSLECAPGAISQLLLGVGPWPLWDSYDGATGGYLLMAILASPLFALFGASGWIPQTLVYLLSVGLIVVVFRFLDAWVGRTPAVLGTAGVAFSPPVLFRASLTFGDWHWTQLLFDYGLAIWVLLLAARARRDRAAPSGLPSLILHAPWCWLVLGLGTGLAVTNSMGSVPFVALVWCMALLLHSSLRQPLSLLAGLGGAVLGASPFLYKLLLHRPFGLEVQGVEKTVSRLRRLDAEASKVWDLILGELPRALHMEAALPALPQGLVSSGASLWVVIVWLGLALGVVAAIRGARKPPELAASLLPAVFVGVFCLAYCVLDIRLRPLALEFANPRGAADRMLPPLLVALLCSSGVGWGAVVEHLRAKGATLSSALILCVGFAPAVVGGISQVGLVHASADIAASPAVYRSACFEPLGFFASRPYRDDPQALQLLCSGLNSPEAARGCRAGAAWGEGFYAAGLSFVPGDAGSANGSVGLSDQAKAACSGVAGRQRQSCLLGLGWFLGVTNWGQKGWPLSVCNDLVHDQDRAGCWRGLGFPLGDHLHAMPERLGAALQRVPEPHRYHVARGAGYSVGRTYSSAEHGLSLCGRLDPTLARGCEAGVLEALAER